MTVATKIGKKFIELVKEEFPPDHPYHSVLNEHTVKFSYSVQPNLKKKIAHHYMKVSQSGEVVSVTDDDYDPEDTTDYDLEEVIPEIVPETLLETLIQMLSERFLDKFPAKSKE